MVDEDKMQMLDEFKEVHQQIAKLWQANVTIQRELLERAGIIERELTKITVILEKDGHHNQNVSTKVDLIEARLSEKRIRIDRLEQLAERNKWLIRTLITVMSGVVFKLLADSLAP